MVNVDTTSFLVIVMVAALAAVLSGLAPRRLAVPVVVLEILLGILVGPELLDIAQPDQFTQFFSNLGLGMLFFFAGYEIEFQLIRGRPLRLAGLGWAMSLLIAYGLAALFVLAGDHDGLIFLGAAMATTAIGTLIPILKDADEMRTRFGVFLLAAGAAGEFGPILIVTLFFSTKTTFASALILIAFILLAVIAALLAVRSVGRGWNLIERSLETSGQLGIRATVVIVFALVALATELGLDLLLGGFVAGVIVSLALRGREVDVLESKLAAVGYGFLIPFFFVFTGLEFDIAALFDSPLLLAGVPLFVLCFLIVRGVPAMLLYRRDLDRRSRVALAVFSATELPLVVAITTIAVDKGEMGSGTAASLVGAAVLSTAVLPMIALRIRASMQKTYVA
ncbi:MAG: cation:proton antiporter [Thermoleophilia bacterium]|nr:cation:proton antiporter [Thermoleophilia bacterium]